MIHLPRNAARRAIADAGIEMSEIDGVATAGPSAIELADMLGIRPRWADGTMIGGCSFMALGRHAGAPGASGAAGGGVSDGWVLATACSTTGTSSVMAGGAPVLAVRWPAR